MTKSLFHKIGLAAFTALVMLGLCELAARTFLPAPPDGTRQPQIVYRYDPEIRYVYVPDQQGWTDDGFANINSLGFRGPEVTVPKPAGRFRVAVIGDSVTMGWGVNDEETYSAQLEQRLHLRFPNRDLDVVNLGVGGYNTRQQVTLLKRYISRLQPDLVLLGFYSNDVPDALDDTGAAAPGGTRIAASNPEAGQILHMNPTPSGRLDRVLRSSRLTYTMGRLFNHLTKRGEWGMSRFSMEIDLLQGRNSADLDRGWELVRKQLSELREVAAAGGFSVGVVVLPCKEQVLGEYPNAQYQRRLRTIVELLGFFVIDPLPALAAGNTRKDTLFIPYDRNHPSAAGHRIIGESIFQFLEEHGAVALTPRGAAAKSVSDARALASR